MNSKKNNIVELERLFDEHYASLLLYSNTIVKDRDDSADIVQRAFISLWEKTDSVDFHSSARAYLYKSVYYASLDLLKQEKVKKRYEHETIKGAVEMFHSNKTEEKELNKTIEHALTELPEQCGRIFKMSRFDGLKYREIANALGISEKTVENQMGKALKILREVLKDHLPILLFLLNFLYVKR